MQPWYHLCLRPLRTASVFSYEGKEAQDNGCQAGMWREPIPIF